MMYTFLNITLFWCECISCPEHLQGNLTDKLTSAELAQLLTKPDVINNTSLLKQIFSHLEAKDVPDYLQEIISAAKEVWKTNMKQLWD